MPRLIRKPVVERNLLRLKTVRDWLAAKLIQIVTVCIRLLPPNGTTAAFRKLGEKLAPILPRSQEAKSNMRAAFPEKSEVEINDLHRRMWGNLGQTFAEYFFLDQLFDFDPENPDNNRVEVVGIDKFLRLRDSDRPVIIFTAHTGNWEILPIAAATYGLMVTALFRPPSNRFLAKELLKARTTAKGNLVPARAGAAWALADVLANNKAVGLLADQAFEQGPHLDFFGRKATANPLAAKLARQYDCDIHPARCIRLPGGRLRLELEERLELPRTSEGEIDVIATTRVINNRVEEWVREYPDQWLWVYNRWKMRSPERTKWQRK